MDLEQHGARLAAKTVQRLEALVCDWGLRVVNAAALARKVQPAHLVLEISGLAHDHPPTAELRHECAYCRRCGNVFAAAAGER